MSQPPPPLSYGLLCASRSYTAFAHCALSSQTCSSCPSCALVWKKDNFLGGHFCYHKDSSARISPALCNAFPIHVLLLADQPLLSLSSIDAVHLARTLLVSTFPRNALLFQWKISERRIGIVDRLNTQPCCSGGRVRDRQSSRDHLPFCFLSSRPLFSKQAGIPNHLCFCAVRAVQSHEDVCCHLNLSRYLTSCTLTNLFNIILIFAFLFFFPFFFFSFSSSSLTDR